MKQHLYLFSILLLLIMSPAISASAEDGVELTYLANEGFLISTGETRVLVDALFGDGLPDYSTVPPAERRDLENATDPFAGVDLVLASHHHDDHFNAQSVGRHLAANPGAHFASTRQAVEKLRREFASFDAIAERVHGFWPDEGQRAELSHGGVELEVLNLHHGRGRPIENLGLLITIGGIRLLHVGDTMVDADDIRPYALGEEEIDIFLVPTWYFNDEGREIIAVVRAHHVVAMHMAVPGRPASWFAPAKDPAGLSAWIEKTFENAWSPIEPFDKKSFR